MLWVMVVLGCLFFSNSVQAHSRSQTRVVHLIATKSRLECYVNFLLPKGRKSAFWIRMFDRDRNRKLDPGEQLLLGQALAKRYLQRFSATLNQTQLRWRLREVQNSRLRGNSLRGSYAWDYRFSAVIRASPLGRYRLSIRFPLLYAKEQIPLALLLLGGQTLLKTSTSYVLLKKSKPRAICRMESKRPTCFFAWHVEKEEKLGKKQVTTKSKRPTTKTATTKPTTNNIKHLD